MTQNTETNQISSPMNPSVKKPLFEDNGKRSLSRRELINILLKDYQTPYRLRNVFPE